MTPVKMRLVIPDGRLLLLLNRGPYYTESSVSPFINE